MAITDSVEAEDLKLEKDHMEHQLNLVRTQMKRLIEARARGETDTSVVEFEPVIYSAKQLRLIRKVLDKWRAHRSFLVNINRIKEVVPWFKSSYQLRLDDKKQTEIPVSRAQTKRLRELFGL